MDHLQFRSALGPIIPHLGPREKPSHHFDDEHARTVQRHLQHFGGYQDWMQCPRTFALLSMLREGRDMDSISAKDLHDDFLPYRHSDLRHVGGLSAEDIGGIVLHQGWFLSSPATMNTRNFVQKEVVGHRNILYGDAFFAIKQQLGESTTAYICRVTHQGSGSDFAGKLIRRDQPKSRGVYDRFKNERSHLERTKHQHVVSCIGTYTDQEYFALILSPIADYDLRQFLVLPGSESILAQREDILRRAFGCLAAGLAYLHKSKIRHRDIKPSNILIDGHSVVICDLGISYDWSDNTGPTTEGPVSLQTRKYAAPEVYDETRRNEKADIWSLGCVFLEIATVLKQRELSDFHNFLGVPLGAYHERSEKISDWLCHLRESDDNHNSPLTWIGHMLDRDPAERPTSTHLLQLIQDASFDTGCPETYIGECCSSSTRSQSSASAHGRPSNSSPLPRDWRYPTPNSSLHNDQDSHGVDFHISPRDSMSSHPRSTLSELDVTSTPQPASPRRFPPEPSKVSTNPPPNQVNAFFGYPDQVAEFKGDNIFGCKISAFEVLRHPEKGPWEPRVPTSSSTFDINVWESYDSDPWKRYRKMEIKSMDGITRESTWLPLRLWVKLEDDSLELRWSNCNHRIKNHTGNYETLRHRVFNPSIPNNHLRLIFPESKDAEELYKILLNHNICAQHRDAGERRSFMVNLKQNEQVAVHICSGRTSDSSDKSEDFDYRIIVVESHDDGFVKPDVYVAQANHDMRIQFAGQMDHPIVHLDSLAYPDYFSDVRDLPYKDDRREGRFQQVVVQQGKLSLKFEPQSSLPTHDMKEFFNRMTNWKLSFLSPVELTKSPSTFSLKRTKQHATILFFRIKPEPHRTAILVFLLPSEQRPGRRWVAGQPTGANSWSMVGGAEAKIDLRHVIYAPTFGELLASASRRKQRTESLSYKLTFAHSDLLQELNSQMYPSIRPRSSSGSLSPTVGKRADSVTAISLHSRASESPPVKKVTTMTNDTSHHPLDKETR